MTPIADPAIIASNASTQTVSLAGITAGAGESETLTVTATSSNTGIIPNPTVGYTSANTTGTLTYSPAGAAGTATVTVLVNDGVSSHGTLFAVAVDAAPTLNSIADPASVATNAGTQTISLAGITDGGDGSQSLTVTATSSDTSIIPNPTVAYTSPRTTGSLTYALTGAGTATATVNVSDGIGTKTRTFAVVVTGLSKTDAFTGTNATALNGHALSGGGGLTWVDIDGSKWTIQSNKASVTDNSAQDFVDGRLAPLILSAGIPGATYAQAAFTVPAANTTYNFGVAIRLLADGTWDHSGYAAILNGNGGDGNGLVLYRIDVGDSQNRLTQIGSSPVAADPGQTYTLKIEAIGGTINVYQDGVLVIDAISDATYGNTRTGMGVVYQSDGTSQTAVLDNFQGG